MELNPVPDEPAIPIAQRYQPSLAEAAKAARHRGPAERSLQPADFMPRVVAAIFDSCLLAFLTGLAFCAGGMSSNWSHRDLTIAVLGLFAIPLLYTLIEVICPCSPGKAMLRLRIVLASGSPAPLGRRAFRWLVRYSPFLLLQLDMALVAVRGRPVAEFGLPALIASFFVCIGSFAALGPRRQTLHDYFTGTAVYGRWDVRPDEVVHGFQPMLNVASAPTGLSKPDPS